MAEIRYDQITAGLNACNRDGQQVGTVAEVHHEGPQGALAPGEGYVVVHSSLSDRTRDLHVPMTRVLEVRPDCVVLELDPDLVAAHDQQVRPRNLPEEI